MISIAQSKSNTIEYWNLVLNKQNLSEDVYFYKASPEIPRIPICNFVFTLNYPFNQSKSAICQVMRMQAQ